MLSVSDAQLDLEMLMHIYVYMSVLSGITVEQQLGVIRARWLLSHWFLALQGTTGNYREAVLGVEPWSCRQSSLMLTVPLAGEMVTKQPLIRSMRTVKRETLKLISGWVSRSNDPQMVRSLRRAPPRALETHYSIAACLPPVAAAPSPCKTSPCHAGVFSGG